MSKTGREAGIARRCDPSPPERHLVELALARGVGDPGVDPGWRGESRTKLAKPGSDPMRGERSAPAVALDVELDPVAATEDVALAASARSSQLSSFLGVAVVLLDTGVIRRNEVGVDQPDLVVEAPAAASSTWIEARVVWQVSHQSTVASAR